jgi:Skp family chaperone for outer membrane proteins
MKKPVKPAKKSQPPQSGSDGDAALRKEIKKLQVKTKKAEATADNLKKKMKQDAARFKAQEDKNKAQDETIKKLGNEIKAIKHDPQRQPEPETEPEPAPLVAEEEETSPEPEVQP